MSLSLKLTDRQSWVVSQWVYPRKSLFPKHNMTKIYKMDNFFFDIIWPEISDWGCKQEKCLQSWSERAVLYETRKVFAITRLAPWWPLRKNAGLRHYCIVLRFHSFNWAPLFKGGLTPRLLWRFLSILYMENQYNFNVEKWIPPMYLRVFGLLFLPCLQLVK